MPSLVREPDWSALVHEHDLEEEHVPGDVSTLPVLCTECGSPVENDDQDQCQRCFKLTLAACNGNEKAERKLEALRKAYLG